MRWMLLVAISSSCGHPSPQIKSFRVEPVGYCPSGRQKIHVSWETKKGATTLQISPDEPAPRSVDATGSLEFDAHDAVVTLTVKDGALAPHVVMPVRAVDHHSLNGLATHCQNGWVSAEPQELGAGAAAFAADVHAGAISNKCSPNAPVTDTCHRQVQVVHGNHMWNVGPDSVLDVTNDQAPMTGPWTLRQQLLAGEQCNSQSAEGALEIDLSLEFGCTKGASYEQ